MKEVIKDYRNDIISIDDVKLDMCVVLKGEISFFEENFKYYVMGSVMIYHPVIAEKVILLIEHKSKKPMTIGDLSNNYNREDKNNIVELSLSRNLFQEFLINNGLRMFFFYDDKEAKSHFVNILSKMPDSHALLDGTIINKHLDERKEIIQFLRSTGKWTTRYNSSFEEEEEIPYEPKPIDYKDFYRVNDDEDRIMRGLMDGEGDQFGL